MHKMLFWTPRVLSLLFVGFISIFALDVFNEYQGWAVVLPLFIHLIPSLFLLLVIAAAWKYELLGAALFFAGAILYVWEAGLDKPWSWYVFIAGPAALVGALYLLSWYMRRRQGSDAAIDTALSS